MEYTQAEILQTVAMTEMEHLDVRTVTLGLSLLDCSSDSMAESGAKGRRQDSHSRGSTRAKRSTRLATSLESESPTNVFP